MTSASSKASIEVLAFDLDGTLVDSVPDLNYCLGEAFESLGLARSTEADTRDWVGDGVEELVRRGLERSVPPSEAEALLSTAIERFSACYARNLFVRTRLYPGVAETLDVLRARGVRLACVTNKRLRFAEALLDQAGLRERFELVLGGDSVAERKPSPMLLDEAAARLGITPDVAAYVGDSYHDMHAAQAARWRFVWASYGYRRIPRDELVAALTIDAMPELAERLEELAV
ncbi:MAG TPA: HAD-IA family hydrolase [Gammaproteobacteria bacterium]